MYRLRQRRAVVALVIGVLLTVLAGCGSSVTAPASDKPASTSGSQSSAAPPAATTPSSAATSSGAAAPAASSAPSDPASTYPSKPVTLLIEHGPGGGVDTGTRLVQPYLQKYLGTPVVTRNMEGGGGNIGRAYVYRQPPDGYTLLFTYQPSMSLGQLMEKGDFDTEKLTPVYGLYGNEYETIVVGKDSPYKTFKDLLDARDKKTFTVSTPGVGNAPWLAAMVLITQAGFRIQIVPFNSGSEAVNQALGGHVDMSLSGASSAFRVAKSSGGRALAVLAPKRLPDQPDVPTVAEFGFPDAHFDLVLGAFAPPNTPKAIVDKLGAAFDKVVKDPEFQQKVKAAKFELMPRPPKEWGESVREFHQLTKDTLPKVQEYLPKSKS